MSRRRVVITGIGPITAFGLGIDPLWSALIEGRSAVRRITRFDPSEFPCQVAAELPDELFDVRSVVPKSYRKATKVMARDIELAVGAAAAAVADAGLTTKATNPDATPTIPPARMGCHIGAGLIAADVNELTGALATSRRDDGEFDLAAWGASGMNNLTPLWLLKYLPNMLACHVTIIHDCQGPSNTITCAEASSALSVGESLRVIQRGAADACLSGGAEFKINPMGLLRQHFAGRLAAVNGTSDPAAVVRPFDESASGSVLGEGGGIVVLEAKDSAEARGARSYAEIRGFASTQSLAGDAAIVMPEGDGRGIADAMQAALDDAGLDRGEIDAIVPLGCGVPRIDRAEASAIRAVLSDRAAATTPLITVMPNVGHCCAGAGAIALTVAARAMLEQRLPARLNTRQPIGVDAAAAPARAASLRNILVVSSSLGGQNAAIVLHKG